MKKIQGSTAKTTKMNKFNKVTNTLSMQKKITFVYSKSEHVELKKKQFKIATNKRI